MGKIVCAGFECEGIKFEGEDRDDEDGAPDGAVESGIAVPSWRRRETRRGSAAWEGSCWGSGGLFVRLE